MAISMPRVTEASWIGWPRNPFPAAEERDTHMSAQPIILETPKKPWQSGSTIPFSAGEIASQFRGPNGGRLVCDVMLIGVDVDDLTTTVAAIQGEDVWRLIQRVKVRQQGGRERVNLKGDQLRVMNYLLGGPAAVPEYADIGIAANQSFDFYFPVLFSKPFALRPRDFSIPIENIDVVEIECASETELAGTGGTAVINDAKYFLILICHEEHNLEFKAEDILKATTFSSTDAEVLQISTGRLQGLALHKQGFSGGTDLTGAVTVRMEGILPKALTYESFKAVYRQRRRSMNNGAGTQGDPVTVDPFVQSTEKAIPILVPGDYERGASVLDGPERTIVTVELSGNAVSSLVALQYIVKPKDNGLINALSERYGVTRASFKTAGKTRRGANAWSASQAAYMPQSAPLPGMR